MEYEVYPKEPGLVIKSIIKFRFSRVPFLVVALLLSVRLGSAGRFSLTPVSALAPKSEDAFGVLISETR